MAHSSARWILAATATALLVPFAACSQATGTDPHGSATTAPLTQSLPSRFERQLAWGTDVALQPAVPESVAYGPNAVAVAATGETLILDRLAGRVLGVGAEGQPRVVASVPVDSEDLIAGSDGALVAFSPLRATAWYFNSDGTPAGEIAVPRALRDLVSLSLGPSRRLTVRTSYQETLTVGSPAAPLPLEVTLAGKREGAYLLPDGRGVGVLADADTTRVVVLSQSIGEQSRSEIVTSHALPGSISAARIVGGQGSTVCLRAEHVTSTPQVVVERRALCVDALSGNVVLDETLPNPGLYVPRTELAFGAGRLSFIHPTKTGLSVTSWKVAGAEVQQ